MGRLQLRWGRTIARAVAVPVALVLSLVSPTLVQVEAAASTWTVTARPAALIEGQATTVTLTVTGGPTPIGCIGVSVPSGFAVLGASVLEVPTGDVWTAATAGSAPTVATFSTSKDTWRLGPGKVGTFAIRVVATTASPGPWTAAGYQKFSLDSKHSAGDPLSPLPPFVITPAPTPRPTSTPAPTATPAPTPRPTSTPAPTATPAPTPRPTSTPAPTATPAPTPRPTPVPSRTGTPALSPAPTGRSTPSSPSSSGATPSPPVAPPPGETSGPAGSPPPGVTPGPMTSQAPPASRVPVTVGGGTAPTASAGTASGGQQYGGVSQLVVQALPAGGTVSLDSMRGIDPIGLFAWLVPGALLALPGLLILLIIVAQVGFAGAFVPFTRRVLGRDRLGDRRRPHAPGRA